MDTHATQMQEVKHVVGKRRVPGRGKSCQLALLGVGGGGLGGGGGNGYVH